MININQIFDFVFCCLSQEQKMQIRTAFADNKPAPIYLAQNNLIKEKHGYRCNKCGKIYPFLQIDYQNSQIDPHYFAKTTGSIRKGKKIAHIFENHYYYAQSENALLKFEEGQDGCFLQTDMIPIKGNVYHIIQSPDKRYIATETFKGTIDIIDLQAKQSIARKQKTAINGAFIFTDDSKLLYFFKDAIRCWDFLQDKDLIIWQIPGLWNVCDNPKKDIYIVCNNVIYNSNKHIYLFQCNAGETTYIVSVQNMAFTKAEKIEHIPTLCKLVYSKHRDQYTLSGRGFVIIYDSDFGAIEKFPAPCLHKLHDGGGIFPVTRDKSRQPNRTFISPDGKWLLLDYLNYVLLMKYESKDIVFCLYSYTGKVAKHMGFVDCNHFWYTWGDMTYIQQIDTEPT